MKKRIISLLSALALTAQIVPCALADNDVKVYVNDTEMITDAPIIIENNRTLVPVRAILEYLDYNVDWDGATQKVTIAKDETTLNLIIGDTQATRDIIYKGNTHSYKNPLEVAPQIINDSTYIPLSDVANAFRLNITWDGDNRYRFDAVIDGTDYIWGYSSSDMSDSDMPSGLAGPQYRLSMRETGNINQWDYSFKHIAVLRNVTCTIVVDCSPEAEAYYHRYEFDFAPEATPVTLISPDDNASVVLNAQAGAKLTFAWNKLPDSDELYAGLLFGRRAGKGRRPQGGAV